MKKIFILLFTLLLLLTISSCKKNEKNPGSNTELEKYTVTYLDNDYGYIYDATKEYNNGDTIYLPELEDKVENKKELIEFKNGYIFKLKNANVYFNGWLKEDDEYISSGTKVTKNITLKPEFVVMGEEVTVNMFTYGGKISLSADELNLSAQLPETTKEHFYFDGWYKDLVVSDDVYLYKNKITSLELSDEIYTIYAKFNVDPEYVDSEIANISNDISFENAEQFLELKGLYAELTSSDKLKITNTDKYNQLLNKWDSFKNKYELYVSISELKSNSDILAGDYSYIKSLAVKLNNLPQEEQDIIPNKNDLLNKLYIAEERYNSVIDEVTELENNILKIQIGSEVYNKDKIMALYNQYKELDSNALSIFYSEKIKLLYDRLQSQLKKSDIYVFGCDYFQTLYSSRTELFFAFFTDFYYFISTKYNDPIKKNNLIANKIYELNDFLYCAGSYDYGRGQMREIGDIAGQYLLTKDINGIVDNQSEDTFIGFCYKNNMYTGLIEFFIRFFAYWRIDEGYASQNNYGADFFAEAWAPTVDIAKFFYYTEETSYVKTNRMLDCFLNCYSVYYGDIENPTTRGYIFLGWYTKDDIKYAQYAVDINQKNIDDAALVDVYIHNLTTSKAVVNKTTVGYVRFMYDHLVSDAKKLVKEYNTLVEIEGTLNG